MSEWVGIDALMESLEVVSMAAESARGTTGEHLRAMVDDSVDLIREAPLTAPLRCFANNTRHTVSLLGEMAEISRDVFHDLSRVNQERLDRIRLLERG